MSRVDQAVNNCAERDKNLIRRTLSSIPPFAYIPPPAPSSALRTLRVYACVGLQGDRVHGQASELNERALRDSEPKPGVSFQIFGTDVIGFALRAQASGARTFTLDYRHAGRQRRMNIGRWPEWSVTAARERAKELRRAIDKGRC